VKLTWSAYALSDRDAIFTYIEADNPAAAILIDERIVAAARRLLDFPARGRVGRIAGHANSSSTVRLTSPPTPSPKRQFEFFAYSMARKNGQNNYR